MTVYVFATLDTKGREAAFVREQLRTHGIEVKLVDCGCVGEPTVPPDIPREEVFRAAGASLDALRAMNVRDEAVTKAA
jgi:uncharacterized protein (UPF0261 family)